MTILYIAHKNVERIILVAKNLAQNIVWCYVSLQRMWVLVFAIVVVDVG